jgi:hypothetical protein
MSVAVHDVEKNDSARDERGFVRRAGVDEPGRQVAPVDRGHPVAGFDGHVDRDSTEVRVLHDAVERSTRPLASRGC